MKFSKIFGMAAMAVLTFGLTAAIASADGTDPRGSVHSPTNPGTPDVGLHFTLDPFGPIQGGGTGLCSFTNGEEDCMVKNTSGINWTDVEIVIGNPANGPAANCDDISLTTDLFNQTICTQQQNGVELSFLGVTYSQAALSLISTGNTLAAICAPNCPSGPEWQQTLLGGANGASLQPICASTQSGGTGGTPGVLNGCDVSFSFGVGQDGGNWATGATFDVSAPEPSTISMMGLGLLGMLMVGTFYKKSQTQN